jgi:hypothetical protein
MASDERTTTMYAETSVIVDGALEESETFFDYALLDEYVDSVREDAEGHGYPTELYILWHDHKPAECECIQYVQDHKPAHSWNF